MILQSEPSVCSLKLLAFLFVRYSWIYTVQTFNTEFNKCEYGLSRSSEFVLQYSLHCYLKGMNYVSFIYAQINIFFLF